jgi:hypothetical protein
MPATVRVPTRVAPAVLAGAENEMVAIPLPDAADVVVSHDVLLASTQEHPASALSTRK